MHFENAVHVEVGFLLFLRVIDHGNHPRLFKDSDLGFHIGDVVFFHLFFSVGCIVDGPQQNAAGLRGVGQSREVDAASLAVFVDHKAAVLTVHIENLVVFTLGIDAALSFAEINAASHIFQNKVFSVQFIVLVGAHGEAKLSVHAENVAQLEVASLILAGSGFSHTDKAAALIHETAQGADQFGIFPDLSAAESGVSIPGVYDNPDGRINSLFHLLKRNEFHIDGHTAQCFNHTYIGIDFAVPESVVHLVCHPAAQISPTVEDSHLKGCGVCLGSLHVGMDLPELRHNLTDAVNKTGPLVCQFQIAAVADSVHGRAQDCPARFQPVVF